MVGVLSLEIAFHTGAISNGRLTLQVAVADSAAAQTLTTTVKNFLTSAGAVIDQVTGQFVPQASAVS